MENILDNVLQNYSYLLYLLILGWTFLEGETVVLVTGALASEGHYNINVEGIALAAMLGSFVGDQMYYYIGRRYGTPLLKRWPQLTGKIEWAFRLVRNHETLFILSFRFIYGVRNVSPFVIGMAGVSRLKYFLLNLVAAFLWSHIFAWGGYLMGRALEEYLGRYKLWVLGGFVVILGLFALASWLRQRRRAAFATSRTDTASVE